MMSVSATSNRAWHDTLTVCVAKPNIRISSIGTLAVAVPETRFTFVLVGVKTTLLVLSQPLVKLFLKKFCACWTVLVSRLGSALSVM